MVHVVGDVELAQLDLRTQWEKDSKAAQLHITQNMTGTNARHTCPFNADATSVHVLLNSVQLPHMGEKNSTSHISGSSRAAICFSESSRAYDSASTMTTDFESSQDPMTMKQAVRKNNIRCVVMCLGCH